MTLGRRVAANALAAFGNQAVLSVLGLLATAVFVRALGAERFGGWGLMVAVVTYAGLFDLGLGVALVRRVATAGGAAGEAGARAAIGAALWASVWLGVAAALVVVGMSAPLAGWFRVAAAHRDEFVLALRIAGIGAGLSVPGAALGAVPTAMQRLDRVLRLELVVSGAVLAVQAGWVLAGGGVVALAAVFTLGRVASLAGRTALARSMLGTIPLRADRYPLWTELGRFGALKVAHQLLSQVVLYLDRFLVGALVSVEAVAYYTVAVDLAQKLLIVQGNVAQAFYPAACELAADRSAFGRLYERSSRVVALLTFPAAILLLVLADPILRVWVGAAFAERSADLLRLVAVAYALMALTAIPASAADALNKPEIGVRYGAVGVVLNVVLAVLLIRALGTIGAGWAVLANVVAQSPWFIRTVSVRLVGVDPAGYAWRAIARPALPSLVMLPVLAGAWVWGAGLGAWRLPVVLVVSGTVFVAGVRWLGRFDPEERQFVSQLPGGRLLRWMAGS